MATLAERVANLRRDIELIQKARDERAGRRWSLMLALIGLLGRIVGAFVPHVVGAVMSYLRRS